MDSQVFGSDGFSYHGIWGTRRSDPAAREPRRRRPASSPGFPTKRESLRFYDAKAGRRRQRCHHGFRAAAAKQSRSLFSVAREDGAAM